MPAPPAVDLGSEIRGSLDGATEREWLVTNGLGGYASGTVSGILTRRYHGLLVAALDPPGRRTLLVSKVDETVSYDGRRYELGANRWVDGSVSPDGFRLLQRFHLEGTMPVWTYACADALIEKRVWMEQGSTTTYAQYELIRGSGGAAELEVKVLVNYRDFHALSTAGNRPIEVAPVAHGLRIQAAPKDGEDGAPFFLLSDQAHFELRGEWYRNFELAAERERGLGDREDHLLAGMVRTRLEPHKPVTLVFTTDATLGAQIAAFGGGNALAARAEFEDKLLEYWVAGRPQAALDAPPWIRQLVLAASQFVVRRPLSRDANAAALLAGYPWFGEWSRDSMIALPGLALETGRPEVARSILRSVIAFAEQGLLPNTFPEAASGEGAGGRLLLYNSADATLWYFEALRQYYAATSDKALIAELYDALADILAWHVRGTRYSIGLDPADGLLHAGEPGVQVTWMDAKVGDRVITARIGKAVEINALWYNALRTMAGFAFELDKPTNDYVHIAERVQASFSRFWNAEAGCCFDVIDGPLGDDAALRPNQILAVSLPESPLHENQRKAIVDVCARRLLTPCGLRSLDSGDPVYQGVYEGSPERRDGAYHQGTVWPWLLGPFVLAHLRVYRDPALAATFLEPIAGQLRSCGLGTINEIFDSDAPWRPRGAIAQAWSVGEILRAWHACSAGMGSRADRAGA